MPALVDPARIDRNLGPLPCVVAPLSVFQRAGHFSCMAKPPPNPIIRFACQSLTEARMLAHYLNTHPANAVRQGEAQ